MTGMKKATIALVLFLITALAAAPASSAAAEDECTLDELVFGKQLLGPNIMEEDCERRISVFFVWGIT